MLKKCFKKIIMAFNTTKGESIIKDNPKTPITEPPTLPLQSPHQLNAVELELLLTLIRQSQFLGEQVETIYNTAVKLQNQFLEQNK
jgi:hypothetical protein